MSALPIEFTTNEKAVTEWIEKKAEERGWGPRLLQVPENLCSPVCCPDRKVMSFFFGVKGQKGKFWMAEWSWDDHDVRFYTDWEWYEDWEDFDLLREELKYEC